MRGRSYARGPEASSQIESNTQRELNILYAL
jgi:hypothetical protein